MKISGRVSHLFLAAVSASALFAGALSAAIAAVPESFYQGKTMRVIVTTTPGGGCDFYARLFARHLPRYIPGRPNRIVQNMPGGGGTVGTNYFSISQSPMV